MKNWKKYLLDEFQVELDLNQNIAFVLLPNTINDTNKTIAFTAKIKELVDNYLIDDQFERDENELLGDLIA